MNYVDLVTPNRYVPLKIYRYIILGWLIAAAVFWLCSPSIFLPKPSEVYQSLHDLWFNDNLGIELFSSLRLNFEAIAIATVISLVLAYSATIAVLRPVPSFVGKLRFLSLSGIGFAFTLMTSNGQTLRLSVLVFMVVVFFVVSMMDVISGIPKEQYDLAKTLRMNDWQVLWEVVILGQADQVFVILRQCAAMSWMFTGTAETMSMSGGGIGMLLFLSNKHFHMAEVMALQLIVILLGIAQDYIITEVRNIVCPYANLERK